MKYISLSNLQNKYPDNIPTEESYSQNGTVIRYEGKYPSNFVNSNIESIDDITTVPNSNVDFIVRFIDETGSDDWTSTTFKELLRSAIKEDNPYFKRSDVTTVTIDFGTLKNYYTKSEFTTAESLAEVTIDETINTKREIFDHISWMISDDDIIRSVDEFGSYTINPTDDFGNGFTPEMKKVREII